MKTDQRSHIAAYSIQRVGLRVLCCRYKKRLKKLLVVHPTFFFRTIVLMTRPFIRFTFLLVHYVVKLCTDTVNLILIFTVALII